MDFYQTEGARICKTFKDDCVIRSISVALREDYKKVFEDLMKLGLEIGAYPSHDKVWVTYLESKGYVKNKPPRDAKGKLIKLRDWNYKGRAVVINSGHLTAVDGGTVIDSWDCRYRPVNSYWAKP
tara:strand:+ start:415 stop:789 length:375 start_codon:yes stop_codon:yes gene_type:complete